MTAQSLNVALIGYKFMGKAHSHAWKIAPDFFEIAARPVLKLICGRHEAPLREFAARWGWQETTTAWRKAVDRTDIDVVDIATPTALHHEIVLAAARAGKHIFCEKPFALNATQAAEMLAAAERAEVRHYLNHNYRRCPAVGLARRLIDDGQIGRIFHWRGAYLQSWIVDPEFPLTWQLQKEHAGSGPHAYLNSHSVDLARYLIGEIKAVTAMTAGFVRERPLADAGARAFQGGRQGDQRGPVTVEDAAFMLAEFAGGALGSFEASRFATGRKNYNQFEIYGERGSLAFNLERMNELEFFSAADPACAQGFRTILATEPEHPYISGWWPPGHTIGYEHEFVHAVVDFVNAVVRGTPLAPDFRDGLRAMQVLDAGLESAASGRKVIVAGSNGA